MCWLSNDRSEGGLSTGAGAQQHGALPGRNAVWQSPREAPPAQRFCSDPGKCAAGAVLSLLSPRASLAVSPSSPCGPWLCGAGLAVLSPAVVCSSPAAALSVRPAALCVSVAAPPLGLGPCTRSSRFRHSVCYVLHHCCCALLLPHPNGHIFPQTPHSPSLKTFSKLSLLWCHHLKTDGG